MAAEVRSQVWVVESTGPFADRGDRRLNPAEPVEERAVGGQLDDLHWQGELPPPATRRVAAPVPPLEHLAERVDDPGRESELPSEALGHFAVGRMDPRCRLGHRRQDAGDRAGATWRRGIALQVPRQRADDGGRPPLIGRQQPAVRGDVVAEDRRGGVGLGRAAGVAQQREIVDVGEVPVAQAQRLAEAHRQQAGPQEVLCRLPEPEIERHGKSRDYLGQPQRTRILGGHRCPRSPAIPGRHTPSHTPRVRHSARRS